MDTRTKIVSAEQAHRLASEGATVVSGYFDPLTATHAERLRGIKSGIGEGCALLVLIGDPEDPVLPARARAELVAGLAVVDHVAEGYAELTPQFQLEREHEAILDELIGHVHQRQQRAGS